MPEDRSNIPPGEPAAEASLVITRHAVQILLGLALALMSLDILREFLSAAHYWPSNLAKTTPPVFFTHWITHMGGPVFVFTIGALACLSLLGGTTRPQLSKYLLTRGFALILLEITLISFGWSWRFAGPVFMMLFWVTGISMVAMAGLIHLPLRAMAAIGLVMIAGANLLDAIPAETLGEIATLWKLLHAGGKAHLGPLHLYITHPIIPWLGIMAAGFAFGSLLQREQAERNRLLVWLGLGLGLAFLLLRALNGYGDSRPWSQQDSGMFTVMSFLNTTRYPPSLQFLLMTLGPAILLLPLLEKLRGPAARVLTAFGRAPFLYLILGLYLSHALAVLVALTSGGALADMLGPFWEYKKATGFGVALPSVYLAWLAVLGLLYAACRWCQITRERGSPKWLTWL